MKASAYKDELIGSFKEKVGHILHKEKLEQSGRVQKVIGEHKLAKLQYEQHKDALNRAKLLEDIVTPHSLNHVTTIHDASFPHIDKSFNLKRFDRQLLLQDLRKGKELKPIYRSTRESKLARAEYKKHKDTLVWFRLLEEIRNTQPTLNHVTEIHDTSLKIKKVDRQLLLSEIRSGKQLKHVVTIDRSFPKFEFGLHIKIKRGASLKQIHETHRVSARLSTEFQIEKTDSYTTTVPTNAT